MARSAMDTCNREIIYNLRKSIEESRKRLDLLMLRNLFVVPMCLYILYVNVAVQVHLYRL